MLKVQSVHTIRPHPARGYLYIGAATLLWGVSATLGRAVFTGRLLPSGEALRPIDPLILSQSRTTFTLLLLVPVLLVTRGWRRLRLSTKDYAQILVIGVLGLAASNYFYYLAIQRTNVATAITVQYTAPIWVLLYSVARGLQKPTIQRIASVFLALVGIALVIQVFGAGKFRLDAIGVIAALAAALAFAFYNIAGHSFLTRHDHWIALAYTTFSASLFWIVINPPWKLVAARFSATQWAFLLIFSLVSMLVPFSFYFAGLRHLEPTRAIVVSCLEPVFSIVIAALALGEVLHPSQIVGIAIVLSAIIVVQLPDRSGRSLPLTANPSNKPTQR